MTAKPNTVGEILERSAMPKSTPELTNSERKRVADLLWTTITNVERGQTAYWTAEQLRHIATIVEPPAYLTNKQDAA